MANFNLAHGLCRYAAHLRCKLEADLCCRTCYDMPQKPATGLCGHTRCSRCIINTPQCACGIVTPSRYIRRNIKITNILQNITKAAPTSNIAAGPRPRDDPQPSSSTSVPGQQRPKSKRSSETELMLFRPTEKWHIRTKIYPLERLLMVFWLFQNGFVLEAIGQLAYASVTRTNISLHALRLLEWVIPRFVDRTNMEQILNLKSIIEKLNFFIIYINPEDVECPVCLERLKMPITTTCGHTFCKGCLIRSISTMKVCPLCRHDLRNDKFKIDDFLYNILGCSLFEDSIDLPVPRRSHDIRTPSIRITHHQPSIPLLMELMRNSTEINISVPNRRNNRNGGGEGANYITVLYYSSHGAVVPADCMVEPPQYNFSRFQRLFGGSPQFHIYHSQKKAWTSQEP